MNSRAVLISIVGALTLGAMPWSAQNGAAQQTTVLQGTVYDTLSGRPVPFAVVSSAGGQASTLADRSGRFRLVAPAGRLESIEVRKIGYRMVAVRIPSGTAVVDVYLRPIPVELATITVTAEADDPARRIITEAIARKNDLLSRIHDYRYQAYVKFTIRDLGRSVDSAESVVLLTETQTNAYWQKPDKYQEVITARRQSSNLDAQQNLVSVGQIVNFNRDRVDLQKYAVVSPTADDALDHYEYRMLDTLEIAGRTVFRLAIEPGSDAAPLFVGMIDIADSTYDVITIDVGANDAVRFDFLENLRYRQHLRDFGDDHWMPYEINFTGEIHVGVPVPGFPEHMSFQHKATLSGFRFDEGNPPSSLGEFMVVVDEDADDADSASWDGLRPEPLSGIELQAFARIDSLENIPPPLPRRILNGAFGALALSSNRDFFHFNRAEGAYLGAGATLRQLSPDLIIRAKSGYSFGRERWQHRYGVQYRLAEHHRLWVGASYRDDIVNRPAIVSGARNSTYYALFGRLDPLDYYREEGFTASVSSRVANFTQVRLQYNDFRQSTAPVVTDYTLFDVDRLQRDNPAITDGRLRSISGSLTFDSRPLLKMKGRDYYLNAFTSTRVTLGGELATPDLIANDFDFLRFYVRLNRTQRTLNLGLTTIDALVAASTGALPPQRYFTVDFGNGVFYEVNGFNTLNETNFSGNRAAMISLKHDFDQQLFRRSRLPLIRDLPFTLSVHGGVFWTDFVDHTPNPGDQFVRTAPSGYAEIGFGIANLTPMFSPFNFGTWFTWQLSSYDTDRFVIGLGIPPPQ